ncbi:MFS transporter [Cryobacterium sp. SO2]|uniref:MFS transporter n=1 Tax=Cryobacterium sp. SO2 TaxID=1897060 RepID=UPI00223D68C2|nr:MFS transporter [Cryobacterium sp. SO2]WEO76492.1 MFS transporter [Cryobacterium sp. SO2]
MSVRVTGVDAASAPVGRRGASLGEQTLLLCCLIGATQMTWGTIVPALPLYVDRFGATALVLGPIIAAFGFGRVLANIPAGILLRWWKPRPYLWAVSLLLVVVTGLTGLAADANSLIAARVVAGVLGGAAITIGFAILVSGAPPARRGRVMATVTAVQMSAGAAGSFLGGLVLTWFPLEVVFLVASVPLALVLAWDALRPAAHYWLPRGRAATTPDASHAPVEPHPLVELVETPLAAASESSPTAPHYAGVGVVAIVIALALSSFATFFARFGGEQGLVPVAAYDTGGLTPLTLGLALAAATLLSLAALPVVGSLIDRGRRLAVLVPGVLASAAALLIFPVANGPWLFALAIVLYGLATSVAGIVPTVLMSEAVPARQSGLVVGITRTAGDLGAVAGPLVALAVYDASGLWPAILVIVALLLLANLTLARLLLRRGA